MRKSIKTQNISQPWAEKCCIHEEVNADAVVTLKAQQRGNSFVFFCFFFRKADSILGYECCTQERGQYDGLFITLGVFIRTGALFLSLIWQIYLPLTHLAFLKKKDEVQLLWTLCPEERIPTISTHLISSRGTLSVIIFSITEHEFITSTSTNLVLRLLAVVWSSPTELCCQKLFHSVW